MPLPVRLMGRSLGPPLNIFAPNTLGPGLTFTRAGSALVPDGAGAWSSKAADVPRYDPAGRLWVETGRQNRARWCRDGTQAVWVKSGATAAKTATGIDGVANSATRLTATGANGTCLQPTTFSSTTSLFSAFVRRASGVGTVEMTLDGGATWTAITLTGAWSRVVLPAAVLANPSIGFRLATSGDAIDFDFAQLEPTTSGLASSPIETGASSVTRAADVPVWALPAGFPAQGTIAMRVKMPMAVPAGTPAFLVLDDGTTNNRVSVYLGTGVVSALCNVAGVTVGSLSLPVAPVADEEFALALTYGRGALGLSAKGAAASVASALPTPSRGVLGHLSSALSSSFGGFIARADGYGVLATNSQLAALSR